MRKMVRARREGEEKGGGKSKRQTERKNAKEKERTLSLAQPSAWTKLSLTSLDPAIDACALCKHIIFNVCGHTQYKYSETTTVKDP